MHSKNLYTFECIVGIWWHLISGYFRGGGRLENTRQARVCFVFLLFDRRTTCYTPFCARGIKENARARTETRRIVREKSYCFLCRMQRKCARQLFRWRVCRDAIAIRCGRNRSQLARQPRQTLASTNIDQLTNQNGHQPKTQKIRGAGRVCAAHSNE